ncbi:uncharacterized protein Gasu_35220 [Galdieria sulphuraria]|uniref:Uncharacterized protein n=1 Tax=Galdieria sulphuraria TaxID=130081 RepID=M2XZQ9_GALSU|nr:uncharacterized protein Gasu_35220 [Galdieria sulphuraria]EME29133.1 hypothetical protein Gasu_35220 [Galdieria sulphuraria]|eukprot:XP_005705653.1 hypothetical protein Gasu_35220 [Galdieria sulphuraria]
MLYGSCQCANYFVRLRMLSRNYLPKVGLYLQSQTKNSSRKRLHQYLHSCDIVEAQPILHEFLSELLCILSKCKLFAQNVKFPFHFLTATTTTTLNSMTFSVLGKNSSAALLTRQILLYTSLLVSHSYRTTTMPFRNTINTSSNFITLTTHMLF